MTRSCVLDITIPTPHGPPLCCVLKLYDPRFGSSVRYMRRGRVAPHTQASEAAFQAFIKQGQMPGFLAHLRYLDHTELMPPSAISFLLPDDDDDDDDEDASYDKSTKDPSRMAKYEAALWRESRKDFKCETRGYQRLAELQGSAIPAMLGHVRLVAAGGERVGKPEDMPPEAKRYFEVKGVLLEYVDGYLLEDLLTSPLAPPAGDLSAWKRIMQSAIDKAHAINERGVLLHDPAPCNVVVDRHSHEPRIVDLARCNFKEEVENWPRDDVEPEAWEREVNYWQHVQAWGNTAALAGPLQNRVKRKIGVQLKMWYPDFDWIIGGIRHGWGESGGGWREMGLVGWT